MNNLMIMRHGPAEPAWGKQDADRQLTPEGLEAVVTVAKTLSSQGFSPDLVVISPLIRCQQTASTVIEHLAEAQREVLTWPELAPGARAKETVAMLQQQSASRRCLLVGHNPDVTELTHFICGPTAEEVRFSPGACCLVDVSNGLERGEGQLIWNRQPTDHQ